MPALDVLIPVAGLALLDTLSPATIGVSLYVLLSGARRVARPLFAYLATVAVFYFVLGCALMLGFGFLFEELEGLADSPVLGWPMVVLGGGMFAYALFAPDRPRRQRRPSSLSTTAMIALGLATGLLEGGTALPYFGAVGIMTTAELSPAVWVPVLAAYNVVMVLPPILLYLGYRALGERLRPRLERWRAKVESGSREAMGWLLGIVGFLVLVHGMDLTGLLDGPVVFLDGL
ncbi:cytochrome c biogenesis protein CcdA [Nocardiopsis arvandica]|uniref:Cytochrome c biogenesis protein CcdA n=1 Tax=Nocardiopsis sinuspersici TaxID=501010 RepID=A0A7Y9XG71_9ACTN|nr:GAP family protein [Nocardiopsis sinuspersici]NYH55226.1 cytochrome c biogenesis protein CcdA [Nocardiopsis sinuspersici]